jgi:acyl carrier protein
MRKEIFETVARFIATNTDIPVGDITMDSTFEDLNMDSLDGLTLVNDLENHYNISIPNDKALKIKSVRETIDNLEFLLVPQQ